MPLEFLARHPRAPRASWAPPRTHADSSAALRRAKVPHKAFYETWTRRTGATEKSSGTPEGLKMRTLGRYLRSKFPRVYAQHEVARRFCAVPAGGTAQHDPSTEDCRKKWVPGAHANARAGISQVRRARQGRTARRGSRSRCEAVGDNQGAPRALRRAHGTARGGFKTEPPSNPTCWRRAKRRRGRGAGKRVGEGCVCVGGGSCQRQS